MPSPIAHCLGGYIFAGRALHDQQSSQISLKEKGVMLAVLLFSANAPDLDFLFGAIMGNINQYHHQASHSLFAILIYTGIVVFLFRTAPKLRGRIGLVAAIAYGSHLGLDYFTKDSAAPFGMRLYWPFDHGFYMSAQPFFERISHGGMSDQYGGVLRSVFSAHNASAIGLELLILAPLALAFYFYRQYSKP